MRFGLLREEGLGCTEVGKWALGDSPLWAERKMNHKGTSRRSLYMWWTLGCLVPCQALGLSAASVGPGSTVGKLTLCPLIYPHISPSTYTSLSAPLQESVQGGLWLNFILRLVQTSGSHCGGVIWNKTSLSGTLSWLMVSLELRFKQGTALVSFPQWTEEAIVIKPSMLTSVWMALHSHILRLI